MNENFKALHSVGVPLFRDAQGKNYFPAALISIDEKNKRALVLTEGEIHSFPIGDIRDFDRVEKAQRAMNAHAELIAALEKAQAWIRQYKACVLALPIAPVDDAINAALAKLNA